MPQKKRRVDLVKHGAAHTFFVPSYSMRLIIACVISCDTNSTLFCFFFSIIIIAVVKIRYVAMAYVRDLEIFIVQKMIK
jgi:hypothetical protein